MKTVSLSLITLFPVISPPKGRCGYVCVWYILIHCCRFVEILESLQFTRYTPRQPKWRKNTKGLHCRISHSRGILNGSSRCHDVQRVNRTFSTFSFKISQLYHRLKIERITNITILQLNDQHLSVLTNWFFCLFFSDNWELSFLHFNY